MSWLQRYFGARPVPELPDDLVVIDEDSDGSMMLVLGAKLDAAGIASWSQPTGLRSRHGPIAFVHAETWRGQRGGTTLLVRRADRDRAVAILAETAADL